MEPLIMKFVADYVLLSHSHSALIQQSDTLDVNAQRRGAAVTIGEYGLGRTRLGTTERSASKPARTKPVAAAWPAGQTGARAG